VIYFIACADASAVKIGITTQTYHASPESAAFARLGQAQVNCPLQLDLVGLCDGGRYEEAEIHQRFSEFRIRGEWFRLVGPVAEFVGRFMKPNRPPRGWHSRRDRRVALPESAAA
jgi:hypothetical protein